MWRTRVGYAGGTKEAPTYRAIGNHLECIEIDFDPEVISYEQLLELFWTSHDPTSRPFANQYSSAILAHDDAQLAAARTSAERYEKTTGREVSTRIERLERFYLAEDYHQKYGLRGDRLLMGEFDAMYADDAEFVNSTAAARVNGYLAGHGSPELTAGEIEKLGLTQQGRERVADKAGTSGAACAVPAL